MTWSGSAGFPFETALAAVGFASLAAATWRRARRTGRMPAEALLLLTTLVYVLGISAGLLLAWSKYVLPTLLLGTLLSGVGVVVLLDRLRSLVVPSFRAASRPDLPV